MQYEILAASGIDSNTERNKWGADEQLEVKVKKYIAQGWRPQGGVSSVSASNGDVLFLQAMVKG